MSTVRKLIPIGFVFVVIFGTLIYLGIALSKHNNSVNSSSSDMPSPGDYGYVTEKGSGLAALDEDTYKRMYNDAVQGNKQDLTELIDSGNVIELKTGAKVYVVKFDSGGEQVEVDSGNYAGDTLYMTMNELSKEQQ